MDRQELESWLKNRPREDAILIAQRAALRVFPIWASQMGQGWAREHNLTSGTLLRCYLTSGVARKYSTPEVKAAAAAAAIGAVTRAYTRVADDPGFVARAAASAVYAATTSAPTAAATDTIIDAAYPAGYTAPSATPFWANIDRDVALLFDGNDLLSRPLWDGVVPTDILGAELEGLENLARETGNRNSFWHRWYFAAKRGEWLDWELQRDVALIPEEVWKQGPKAVMAAIAEIEARHDLRQQVATLRQQVEALQAALVANGHASAAHRSHNNPPELLDIPAPVIVQVNALLSPLQQAEAELVKPAPDKSVLKRLAAALKGFLSFSAAYCGKTLDTLLQEVAKSIGQQVGPALKWLLLANGAAPLLEALQKFLPH